MMHRYDELKRHYRWEEAFVAEAARKAFPRCRVNAHPETAVDLVPDVVVEMRPGVPRAVVCVTRGSAQNAVQVKAWRDTYECLLHRRAHPRAVLVRVVFGERGSPAWACAMERLFDVHVWVRDLPGGAEAEAFLHRYTRERPLAPGDALLQSPLPPAVRKCLDALAGRIRAGRVGAGAEPHVAAGTDLCEPFSPTALRRAVVLGGLAGLAGRGDRVPAETMPEMQAWGVCDARGCLLPPWAEWMESARAAVGLRAFADLVGRALPSCAVSRKRLRAALQMLDFFREWHACLSRKKNPGQNLGRELRMDPAACASFGGHPVLLALRYLLKLHGKDAFGHSRLLERLELGRDTHDLLQAGRWFGGKEPLPESLPWERIWPWVEEAATILASAPNPLRRIGDLIFHDEAMKNPHVEPLVWLLQSAGGENWTWEPRRPTILEPEGTVATVRCLRHGRTAFHWKTTHEGHRDKTKELAAKGMAMRMLQPKERYVLLLDGDFGERDAGALAGAGAWDLIVPVSSWRNEGEAAIRRILREG